MSILVGGMCSIRCHVALVLAFMHLYSIFNCVLSIHFSFFFKSGIETPDRNGQWYQHLLTLFAIFYKSSTEGTNFQIMCVRFLRLCNVHVLYCVRFELVKIPEVTLCG